MLLGQLVAISFAMNLSFVAVLASAEIEEAKTGPRIRKSQGDSESPARQSRSGNNSISLLRSASLVLTLATIYKVPSTVGTRWFFPTLLIPHILLFIPVLLSSFGQESRTGFFDIDFWIVTASGVGLFVHASINALTDSHHDVPSLLGELRSHPAVSSVGWDVIICWLSAGIWLVIRRGSEPSYIVQKRLRP